MRPSGQISTLETLPPPSNTPLTARLTSASVNFDFDIPTTSDEDGLEQAGA
jgi:heme/copper-type cytochrome/quinol oxidase subunit 2